MKNKHLLFACVIALTACDSDIGTPEPVTNEKDTPLTLKTLVSRATAEPDYAVSVEEVENVIKDFSPAATLSRNATTDYSTSAICDNNGNPVIYVINFDAGGFVLVSANKKMPPVLAYNDKGHFDVSGKMPEGLTIWKDRILEQFEIAETMPSDSIRPVAALWNKYAIKPLDDIIQPDEDLFNDPNFREAMSSLMTQKSNLVAAGNVEIFEPGEIIDNDENFSNQVWRNAQDNIYPTYMEYWDYLSFAARVDEFVNVNTGNFVEAEWDQYNHFNELCPEVWDPEKMEYVHAPAGCVAIAGAQLMYYYKYPDTFNWEGMDPYIANWATVNLIKILGEACNTKYYYNNSKAKIWDLGNVLNNYGYNTYYHNGYYARMDDELLNKKPVIVGGKDRINEEDKHSWLISGIKIDKGTAVYYLYTATKINKVEPLVQNNIYYRDLVYYYMNWGWFGQDNGMYIKSNYYHADQYDFIIDETLIVNK